MLRGDGVGQLLDRIGRGKARWRRDTLWGVALNVSWAIGHEGWLLRPSA